MPTLHFDLVSAGGRRAICIAPARLVIAGWTGRDPALREAHARELALLGVPRPSAMPLFYRAGAQLLTQEHTIEVLGPETSGEAEVVLIAAGGALYVGVGSDHTDRRVERSGVALAKQCCPKPVGRELWPLEEVAGHWDQLLLRAYVPSGGSPELYQEGELARLQPPRVLIGHYGAAGLPDGTALFCGTLPARGPVRASPRFDMELVDPVRGRSLRHGYALQELPVVS
ncbi:MAG TPA: DUF2848 domain-containing protein [Steroidobacteraceae bacterium]|nr:DUF2848 domain-containing protein [Steroidobacteraceae bacterium]